jgi:hypothetical protein
MTPGKVSPLRGRQDRGDAKSSVQDEPVWLVFFTQATKRPFNVYNVVRNIPLSLLQFEAREI